LLKRLKLCNFKCFGNTSIRLSPLTLLTGVNGSGKSAIIQSLLLVHQSLTHQKAYLDLNDGKGLALGCSSDVLCTFAKTTDIKILLEWENPSGQICAYEISLNSSKGESLVLPVKRSGRSKCNPFDGGFSFLEAERFGPRDFHSMASLPKG